MTDSASNDAADTNDTTAGAERRIDTPCDLDTFCSDCLTILRQTSDFCTRLHRTLRDVVLCGRKCKFCHFICTSFGWNEIDKILLIYDTERMPYVKVAISNCRIGDNRLVQRAKLDFTIYKHEGGALTWRTFDVFANGARGLDRAIWCQSAPVDFAARRGTLLEWLEECRTCHPKCRGTLRKDSPLAARILEIRSENGNTLIRLVSTQDLDLHSVPYLVLSHCWGKPKIECKTTGEKLSQYLQYIDFDSLPKSFREAIEITKALRFCYLWIDSLCIVQDDDDDWERESAKMASIFRGATLTISATTAHSSLEGCGISTVLTPSTQFTTKVGASGETTGYIALRECTVYEGGKEDVGFSLNAPIQHRAWIFQEKILSRRILHATHSLFTWQCATHVETEDSLIYEQRSHRPPFTLLAGQVGEHLRRPDDVYSIRSRWWSWVKEYIGRDLTFKSDHYSAFAGVTALYQELTGEEPVLGMWKEDLHLHLGWYAHATPKWEPVKETRQPSWTWMSFQHGSVVVACLAPFEAVEEGMQERTIREMRYKAQVSEVKIEWTGRPLVSEPAYGHVKLRGLQSRINLPLGRQDGVGIFDPDVLETGASQGSEFDMLALYAYEEESSIIGDDPTLTVVGLLIQDTGVAEGEYRRIGQIERYFKLRQGTRVENHLPGLSNSIKLV